MPSLVRMPRPNELPGLHVPHQAAQLTRAWLAMAVIECPAPLSASFRQSAPDVLCQVAVLAQTYSPPATQYPGSALSAANGAMNRGSGSWGSMLVIADGVPSVLAV